MKEVVHSKVTYYEHEPCAKDFIELLENRSYNKIISDNCQNVIVETGAWTLNHDQLTFTSSFGKSLNYKVVIVNKDFLVIEGLEDRDGDGIDEIVLQALSSL